jgi:diguanylate cyclase (GGDEF)-like protein
MSAVNKQEKAEKQESPRNGFIPLDPFKRVAWICGILPAGISLTALLGWEINLLSLASLSTAYIPMAPNTALAFLILSGVLLLYIYEPRNTLLPRIAKASLVLVAFLGLVTLFQFFSGVDMGIDEVLHRTSQKFDRVLIGRMSPITAANFIFASLALLFLISKFTGGKWVNILAAVLAVTVIAVGWVVVLGYMYQAPLLYGQTIIPMALTTGIAFIFTGTGIIAAIGPESWPLNSLIGSSMRARLLQVFLPVTAAIVLIQGWLQTVAVLRLTNPALKSALMAALFLVVVSIIVSQIARIVGGAIDHAESERRRAEDLVQHIAFYDVLTDLPNRNLLYDRLLNGIQINKGNPMALMIMDLDRFKEINDTLGHSRGDLLLQQVGGRLKNTLFKPDVVARLGGDEFAILLLKLASLEHVDLIIQKILRALEMPFVIEGIPIIVEGSIGIALYPDHGTDPDSLIQKADVAMYGAKRSGSYNIYSVKDDHYSPRRLALMGELRQAIEQNQLFLHYQPKIDLKTRRFTGVEALVRWRHPKHGVIPPDQFIGPAEQTGLIVPLTQWVLRTSLEQHVKWREPSVPIMMRHLPYV